MKISFSMPPESMILSTGFGQAGFNITTTLQALGHEVPFRDPAAPVEMNFAHPQHWVWSGKDQYRIGYTPWESSAIPEQWKMPMQFCDELWTPSPVIAQWLRSYTDKDIKVYEHGVDHELWSRKKRRPKDQIRFLHIGEPAPRKGGQLAFDAFVEAFGDRDDATLTIKAHHYSTIRAKTGRMPHTVKNVNLVANDISDHELVSLVKQHDVLVYPGYGEGFGLIALQAMATGMPVICTEAWAPYKSLLVPDLRLSSKIGDTLWPEMHPGKVFHPDRDHLIELYRKCVDDFPRLSNMAYRLSFEVAKRYDWKRLTAEAFAPIVDKFGG